MKSKIIFSNFKKEHDFEVLNLWRKSFHQAIGFKEDTREKVVKEHLDYLQSYNPDIIRVALEENENKLIGFMAKEENIIVFANGGDRQREKDISEATVCRDNQIEMKFNIGGGIIQSSSSLVSTTIDKPWVIFLKSVNLSFSSISSLAT